HPGAALVFRPGDAASLDGALAGLSARIAADGAASMVQTARRAAAGYGWDRLAARLVDFCAGI
nr:hypothetical protein [Kiritimatiellia bacterium]